MDYSKYYLKNYIKNNNRDNYESEDMSDISFDNQSQNKESMPKEGQTQKFYAQNGKVEIEVVPQLTSVVETNYSINDNDVIVDIEPQDIGRRDNRRKGVVMTLAVITCLLIAFVVGDFASNGELIASITALYKNQEHQSQVYYGLILKSTDDYQQARIYSDQMRLQGGGGYIVKSDNKYIVLADIYDDLQEANAVVEKNNGSSLISYSIQEIDYQKALQGGDELVISMGGYSASIIQQLTIIGESLTKLEIDKAQATEKIQSLLDNLQIQYDQIKDVEYANENILLLTADINTTLGLLQNLTDSTASRPNLVCDIRYTKIQLVINYMQLTKNLSQK